MWDYSKPLLATCLQAQLRLLTRFSTPPAITSDCGTEPSAGKVNSSPA